MPKDYELKKPPVDKDGLKKAVEEVLSSRMTVLHASKYFAVKKSTLYSRLRGRLVQKTFHPSDAEEHYIVLLLQYYNDLGCHMGQEQTLDLIEEYVKNHRPPTPVINLRPDEEWYRSFRERNKEKLTFRTTADGNREFHQILQDVTHLKRDVASISEGMKNDNGSYEKVTMTSPDPIAEDNKRHKSLIFEEQTCVVPFFIDDPETMVDTENVKSISGEMLNHYSIMLQDNKELRKASGYNTTYSDLCAVLSSETSGPQEIITELETSDDVAESKSSQEKEKRKDNFECTFCGEEFDLGDLYRTHVIEEHYNKSIGTFWEQRCFQSNNGSG
ncbi:uncharacterized protein LOC134821248 [Bolinopsis microptera]|uniref:uncharacterized protein LOC134821248 n=1 Tax=Bolinopsis microptera TaxID=2820187 RepID=UPI0030798543